MSWWIALRDWPDEASAQAWVNWALRRTSRVAWHGTVPGVLLLELAPSLRLLGGRAAVLRQLQQAQPALGSVQWACGATSLIAAGRLLAGPDWRRAAPDGLLLAMLPAALPHLDLLRDLGCLDWGSLRALPREALARRCGPALLQALDQAYGQAPESHCWLNPPETFRSALELPQTVDSAPALLFAARRLLQRLQDWLQRRQRGVLALELDWTLDVSAGRSRQGQLVLRLARPLRDAAQLERLLAERLQHVRLPAPVQGVGLHSLHTEVLELRSHHLLPPAQAEGADLQALCERLVARLGSGRVCRVALTHDPRPECRQRWQPLHDATECIAPSAGGTGVGWQLVGQPQQAWPTWLLAAPQALALRDGQPDYHGPLQWLQGPQRLEVPDWDGRGAVLRDYYVARSTAGLLWVFCQRAGAHETPRWFLHGVFA